jgi:hypothetical protein
MRIGDDGVSDGVSTCSANLSFDDRLTAEPPKKSLAPSCLKKDGCARDHPFFMDDKSPKLFFH